MKNTILTSVLLFVIVTSSVGQCEFPNQSFEDWSTVPYIYPDGMNGELTENVELPNETISFLRAFLLGFSGFFDPSFGTMFSQDPQGFIGVSKSTDASDGAFAVKLQSTEALATADIYSVAPCGAVPEEVSLKVKHIGDGVDTVRIAMVWDSGLNAVPQDSSEFENLPGYAQATLILDGDSDYETVNMTPIANGMPVDTMYFLIIASFSDVSNSVLVDDIKLGVEDVEPLPDVVINEVGLENSTLVEILNVGDEVVDLSNLFLSVNGQVTPLAAINNYCSGQGMTILPGSRYVAFTSIFELDTNNGEVVLATSPTPSADQIVDYVAWGDQEQPHENAAILASQWTSDSRVAPFYVTDDFSRSGSIEYDGTGNTAEDWYRAPVNSLCEENGTGCDIDPREIFESDLYYCTCDGDSESINVSSTGGGFNNRLLLVDEDGVIRYFQDNDFVLIADVCYEGALFMQQLAYNGVLLGLEEGVHVDDLDGCYSLSNKLEFVSVDFEAFTFSTMLAGGEVSEQVAICPFDDLIEIVEIMPNVAGNFLYVVTDENDAIVREYADGEIQDIETLTVGQYTLVVVQYEELSPLDRFGKDLSEAYFGECARLSDTSLGITILEEGANCVVNANDLLDQSIAVESFVAAGADIIINSYSDEISVLQYQLYSAAGKLISADVLQLRGGQATVSGAELRVGLYFLLLHTEGHTSTQKVVVR